MQTLVQTKEVNCFPQPEVKTEGTPNLATQEKRKALTRDSAVMKLNGATSGQSVIQSIMDK